MTWRQRFVFYILIPLAIATQNGVHGSVYAPELPPLRTVLFWVPVTLLSWALADGFSRAIYRATRAERFAPPWAPRLAILPLGGLVAAVVCYYLIGIYLALTRDFFGALHTLVDPGDFVQRRPFLSSVLAPSALMAILVWTVVNVAFDRLFGVPRLRPGTDIAPAPDSAAVPAPMPALGTAIDGDPGKVPAPPAFLARLAPDPSRDLLAVEAQEHYIKVYTRQGSELLLYRFKDAVKDLAPYGLQVHRSHWVARSAIAGVDCSSRALRLTLRNGQQVPVSTAYRGALKLAGVL
jgi:hypothetical protein